LKDRSTTLHYYMLIDPVHQAQSKLSFDDLFALSL
jgi:hypothetical protein